MTDWQNKLTNYVTGTAFLLSLSRNHVSLLVAINENGGGRWESFSGRNSFVPIVDGLIRRGLVEHNPEVFKTGSDMEKLPWIYRTTPAGELVMGLLIMSGVVELKKEKVA